MDSCAFMNGQLQHLGPSQTTQVASHHQQTGALNNICQYRTAILGAQPPQSTHFTNLHNQAHFDGQESNSRTSAGSYQVVSSQQTEEWTMNSHRLVATNQQNQSNNPPPFGRYSIGGFQVSTTNLVTQSPSNNINSTYVQQQLVANKQQTVNMQNVPNRRSLQSWYQNPNCASIQPPPTTASLPCQQVSYTNRLAPPHREAAQNQIPRQNNTQNQFPSSIPPAYNNRSHITHYRPAQLNTTNALNPAATQQQVFRQNMPPGNMYNSSTPPFYSTSACSTQQFVSNAKAADQNTLALSSADLKYHNVNRIQSLLRQAVNFRTQQPVNTPLQQNVVQNVPCVPSAGETSGTIQADNSVCLKPKGRVLELLTDSSKLKQQLEEVSSRTNGTQPCPANGTEITETSEMLPTKVTDGSIYMSQGQPGTKAVAVVQPLSQDCSLIACEQAFNTITDDSLNNPEKVLRLPAVTENDESRLNPDQMMSNKAVDGCSSNDGALSSSSSELSINTAPDVQITAQTESSPRQTSPVRKTVMETPGQTFHLFSLPTAEYTLTQARNLTLRHFKTVNTSEQFKSVADSLKAVLHVYWNGSVRTLLNKLKTGSHMAVIREAEHFCKTHIAPDSVIMHQVKQTHQEHLKDFYVLKDNDVFSEPPYKSSWLNINEQLDDIDKEFGFPQHMKFFSGMQDNESQNHQATTDDNNPSPSVSEEPTVFSQAEEELSDSITEEGSSVPDASTQPLSPNDPENDMSSDPHYSFKIQVLSPEEAKLIFGLAQSEVPPIIEMNGELETVLSTSVESNKAEETDTTPSESNRMTSTVCPIEQFCCVTNWMESILGTESRFTTGCNCKDKQSEKEAVKTLIIDLTEDDDTPCSSSDEETKGSSSQSSIILRNESEDPSCREGEIFSHQDHRATLSSPEADILEQLNCTLLAMESGALISRDEQTESTKDEDTKEEKKMNSASAAESTQETQEQSEEQTKDQPKLPSKVQTKDQPKLPSKVQTKDQPKLPSKEQTKEQPKLPRKEQTKEQPKLPRKEQTKEQPKLPRKEQTKEQPKVQSKEQTKVQSKEQPKVQSKEQTKKQHKVQSKEQTKEQPQVQSKEQTKEQPQIHSKEQARVLTPMCSTQQKKRPRGGDDPAFRNEKKRRLHVDHNAQQERSGKTAHTHTVQLTLFGSAQKRKHVPSGEKRIPLLSPERERERPRPPEVLSVNVRSLKEKSNDPTNRREYSVKQRLHESWRKSFSPTKHRHRNVLKTKGHHDTSSSRGSLKKEKQPNSSVKRGRNGRTKWLSPNVQIFTSIKHGERTKQDGETYEEHGGSSTADHDDMIPLRENTLRFSMLSKTFSFKEGSNRQKDPTCPASDKKTLIKEEKNRSRHKTVMKEKVTWYPYERKRHPPPSVPKATTVFQEFQKKYKKKMQSSTDE